jgi:CBS domain-containing protein
MSIRARDVMQTQVVVVSPSDSLAAVMRLFSDEGIHGAPVVDEQGRVVGVISASDLLRAAADADEAARPGYGYFEEGIETFPEGLEGFSEVGDRRAEDVMTEAIVWVQPTASIAEVARTLRESRVHRALVLEDETLVGIISSFDLIAVLEKQGA